jgi:NADH-quinone oxidoreductase subunit J
MDLSVVFYTAATVSIFSTIMVITRYNGVHALLWLILSLLAMAMVFFTLGAPFLAALEVVIYAGAIMVLFIFVVMMLNLGQDQVRTERKWLSPWSWVMPSLFCLVLLGELVYILSAGTPEALEPAKINPKAIGNALYGPYLLGVELTAILLMAGIVGAYHIGRKKKQAVHRYIKEEVTDGSTR